MKIPVGCMQCIEEGLNITSFPMINNINEEDVYEITCEYGHKNYFCIQNEKFDILFTLAIQALSEGYYREAVLNFTSALERFYEFGIKLMLKINKVDQENIALFYKEVSKFSERELGAYASLYLLTRKIPPKLLSGTKRSFRNDIVHGGISPKYEKVVDYGKTVHELIKNDYLFFKKNYAINMINANLDRRSRLAAPNGYPIGTCLITSYIEKECPIEDMIDDINDLNLFVNNIEQLPIVPLN